MISHFVKVTQLEEVAKREKQIGTERREQSKSGQEFGRKQFGTSRD